MKPVGEMVEHTFAKTTVVGDHTFFAGKTMISKRLLDRHKAEERRNRELAEAAAAEEGMTVEELRASRNVGGITASAPEGEGEGDGELRTDGPTLEEWVEKGYPADKYPPQGYAAVPSKPIEVEE